MNILFLCLCVFKYLPALHAAAQTNNDLNKFFTNEAVYQPYLYLHDNSDNKERWQHMQMQKNPLFLFLEWFGQIIVGYQN